MHSDYSRLARGVRVPRRNPPRGFEIHLTSN
jgi:hypothetical protein